MQLYYRHYPSNATKAKPLVVLHGLFGSNTNWASLARRFALHQPVYAVDLRNHGQSPHADSMSFAEMAADVLEFIQAHQLSGCHLLGHSMGGKVAMQLALENPDLLGKLLVADIAPKVYPPRHQEVFAAIDTIDRVELENRQQADELISDILPEQSTRLFLLSNLQRDESNKLKWRINMQAIREQYEQISAAPSAINNHTYSSPCLFLRGSYSSYLMAKDEADIQRIFVNCQFTTIDKAGHWLHVEQSDAFIAAVNRFLGHAQ